MSDEDLLNVPVGSAFVFDVESYPNLFYAAFKHVESGQIVDFEISERGSFDTNKLSWFIWRYLLIGFNSNNYDLFMLLQALDPKVTTQQLKALSDDIIVNRTPAFQIENKYKITRLQLNSIDLIEVAPLTASLKTYAGRLHCARMQDLPYSPDAELTTEQAEEVKSYCVNDLDNTELMLSQLKDQIDLRVRLSAEYQIDLRSKSDAQIAEAVIGNEIAKLAGIYPRKPKISENGSFRYRVPDYIHFQTPQFQQALEVVRNADFVIGAAGNPEWPRGLTPPKVSLGATTYQMGIGGLHSCEKCAAHVADRNTVISDHDVESYYPRIILNQELYPQHLGQSFLTVFDTIVGKRVAAKRGGDKTTADSLKITINGTFGKLGSRYSILYAPDLLLQVTLTGQLSLMMLAERFELEGISVISANTDGIVIKLPAHKLQDRDRIIKQWEVDAKFVTEETRYLALYSRDVNNYIAIKQKRDKASGEWLQRSDGCKVKGFLNNPWADPKAAIFRFFKNPEATICIEAVENFITNRIPIEDTISGCCDITKFVCVRKVKGGAVKNGAYLGKTVRWYYAEGEAGCLTYAESGNKVPKSEGGKPCMDLPPTFPDDVAIGRYVAIARDMLEDIGCLTKVKSGSLF